jgi:hypothetical protein
LFLLFVVFYNFLPDLYLKFLSFVCCVSSSFQVNPFFFVFCYVLLSISNLFPFRCFSLCPSVPCTPDVSNSWRLDRLTPSRYLSCWIPTASGLTPLTPASDPSKQNPDDMQG